MKTFILFFIFNITSYSQFFEPKQLTFFDSDCRNPVFIYYPLNYPDWNYNGEVIFERYEQGKVNLFALDYDEINDTFFQSIPITNDTFTNKNATAMFFYNENSSAKIVVWQTNKNGNWDIAHSIKSDKGWSEPLILYGTSDDETNPVFIKHSYGSTEFLFNFLFEREGSIWIYTQYQDSSNVSVVFQSDRITKFYSPTGMNHWSGYYIAAIADDGVNRSLVYTNDFVPGQVEPQIMNLYNSHPVRNPKFVDILFDPLAISFEIETVGKYKSVIMDEYSFGTSSVVYVDSDSTLETNHFNGFVILIITDYPSYLGIPAVYQLSRNDSTFVISNEGLYMFSYLEIHTKVKESSPNVGPLGFDPNGYVVSYSVWEDSTGLNINLFGLKRLDSIGDVDENKDKKDNNYILLQNYPNPFNPTTSIEYRVGSIEKVTLKVYDVLGREVATLVNEEKLPGVYEVEFNPVTGIRNLASGIYYYQIKAGDFIETKKMIYLK